MCQIFGRPDQRLFMKIFSLFDGYADGGVQLLHKLAKRLTKLKFLSLNLHNLSQPQDISLKLNKWRDGLCIHKEKARLELETTLWRSE